MGDTDLILDRLTRLYPKAIEPGLERTLRILRDLGDPHLKIPPVIHIAGTNGKGSTLAFIHAIAEDAGLKIHAMTSPHLVKFNERLVVASEEITDENLQSLLEEVEAINADQPTTFFEITTAAGFYEFARRPANLTLLETGMGGRLDSTNVIENPLVTIITNISHDHMQHLGNTLREIAIEKAGIMKPGVPCVIGPQTQNALAENVMEIFEDRAEELGCPLYRHGHEWNFMPKENGFMVNFRLQAFHLPAPSLLGAHQIANAATAIAALCAVPELDRLKQNFSAVSKAVWPARLQRIESGPLFDLLSEGWALYLDGGHNEAGGEILGRQAKNWQDKDLHLVLGMLTTKDPAPFYDHLRPFVKTTTAIPIPDEKLAFSADDLSQKLSIEKALTPEDAIRKIIADNKPGRILITGSLYLAGSILKNQKLA